MDSLLLFRSLTKSFLSNGQIASPEEWRQLMKYLCDNKIILPVDVKSINQKILVFPLKIDNFERIIMQSKTNDELVRMLFDAQKLQQQLSNCKSILTIWKEYGLTKEELQQLSCTFDKFRDKLQQVNTKLETLNQNIGQTQEQHIQIIDNLKQFKRLSNHEQAYHNSDQYQQIQAQSIDNYYNSIRVRQTNYRNQPIKILANKNGIVNQIGYNTKNDEPLEVIKIPKMYNDFYKLQIMLNSFNALKQLMFSQYFPKFLGYNTYSDNSFNYYYIEYLNSTPVCDLLKAAKYKIHEDVAIYQYWIRQIFYSLKDILYQSTYMPVLPITLDMIHVSEKGLRILLKGVQFSHRRNTNETHDRVEGKLLANYGALCLALLDLRQTEIESIKNIDFKCLLKALLYAEKQQQRLERGISGDKLTFSLCNYYPMLSQKNMEDIDPGLVTGNYHALFQNN